MLNWWDEDTYLKTFFESIDDDEDPPGFALRSNGCSPPAGWFWFVGDGDGISIFVGVFSTDGLVAVRSGVVVGDICGNW